MPSTNRVDQYPVSLRNDERRTLNNGDMVETSSPSTVSIQPLRIEKDWATTPGFFALRKAKARLPDNYFRLFQRKRSDALITYRSIDRTSSGNDPFDTRLREIIYDKAPASYIAPYGSETTLTRNQVISQLIARAKGAEFNAPVFLGEARETGRMILSTAKDLASAYRSLRKGNIADAYYKLAMGEPSGAAVRKFNRGFGVNPRKAAANRWLEMQYGWKPLLADVKNAAEQLAEMTLDDVSTIGRVTGFVSKTFTDRGTVPVEVSPDGQAFRVAVSTESTKATWKFQPTGLNDLGSLGLLNPLSVAWELLPLSFVVDWMFPIGRYLEQLDTSMRFTHAGGTFGYKRQVDTIYSSFIRDGVEGSGAYQTNWTLVERVPMTSAPSLGLESIWFEPKLGATRVLSGLALASQAFKR